MKKIFAILLAVTMFASMATVASAESTTTLTTTVPPAEYTLNIPANQEVAYGATTTIIGQVTITDSKYFAKGKNVNVTVNYTEFTCEDVSTTIPFVLECSYGPQDYYTRTISSGGVMEFLGQQTGKVEEYATVTAQGDEYHLTDIKLKTNSTDWGKALAGEYTATITFTCEVVVEE